MMQDGLVENESCKILWDMTIQCDHVIKARRPDVVVKKESNRAIIVDIASPWDHIILHSLRRLERVFLVAIVLVKR